MPDRDMYSQQTEALGWFEEERGDLLNLAHSILAQAPQARGAFGDFLDALQSIRAEGRPALEVEAELARRALELRRLWLAVAHRASDRTMKSPLAEQVARTPSGTVIDYGYERDLDPSAVAPFCLVHLKSGDIAAYRTLETRIGEAVAERGLLFDRGGSFGFRGHRYEVVEPTPDRGAPFLRIAMGARGGPSLNGIMELMRELLA